ncbi:ATP-binding protein [Pseudoalteromonas fenneropenaei]|uniref:histidine kinase n=1 Tax=Pseudoalteromonas fenneropenaei TaxID=1737459 RepID=A0ABV7CNI0_9GAMM
MLRNAKRWLKAATRVLSVWLTMLVCVGLLIANVIIGMSNTEKLNEYQLRIENTSELILALDNLHIAVLNAQSNLRAYLLSQDEAYLQPFEHSISQLNESIARVTAEKSESASQQARIRAYLATVVEQIAQLQSSLRKLQQGARNKIQLLASSDETALQLSAQYRVLLAEEMKIREVQRQFLNNVRNQAQQNILWFAILSALLLSMSLLLVVKNLRDARRAEARLSQANQELESKVAARTATLQQLADELNKSNRELEDFAFVASHDLQEPLRKIQAFGDRLKNTYHSVLDAKAQDYLARMNSAAARMSLLINDLLALSRVATKQKPFQQVALNDIVDGALDDLEVAISEAGATVTVGALPQLDCDASQIRQLCFNLLANAIKFRRSDVLPNIVVSEVANPVSELVSIEFKDNGIGFEAHYQDKIFSPFQRLHDRNEYPGTGIGLALCRRIVERHGGSITADSALGQGATFIVTLPRQAQPILTQEISNYE